MVTNSFGNRTFMQPMGRLSMHSKCLDFFSFKFWVSGGRWGGFFSFFLSSQHVLVKFPSGSQYVPYVPYVFPKVSIAPHLLPYVLPKVLPFSPIYRWANKARYSIIHRIFYFGEFDSFTPFFLLWPIKFAY
jgi:hypothetical protein